MSKISNLLVGGLASALLLVSQVGELQAEQKGNDGGHGGGASRGGGARSAGPRTSGASRSARTNQGPRNSGGNVTARRSTGGGAVHASGNGNRGAGRRHHNDGDGDGNGHRGTRYVWGDGGEYWFYDGYYHGNCAWLLERAEETGSSYWRRRYRLCRVLS